MPHFSETNDGAEIIYADELDNCEIGGDIIFDENIPANFEEEVVCNFDENYDTFVSSTESIDDSQSIQPEPEAKFKQTLVVNRSLLKTNQCKLELAQISQNTSQSSTRPSSPQHSARFNSNVNFKPTNFVLNEHTMRIFKNKIKAIQKRRAQTLEKERKKRPKKIKRIRAHSLKKSGPVKPPQVNVTVLPQKSKAPIDLINSGEIIRVAKEESDVEVDILSNSEDDVIIMEPTGDEESNEDISIDDADSSWTDPAPSEETVVDEILIRVQELKESDQNTFVLLESQDVPIREFNIEASSISNLERFMHSEFFLNRPTKTPERYLKIRNHIINMWYQSKPNYLSKTAARSGLKKCGDVNCISRIHSLLEQIGAINFGCAEVNWIRPLSTLYEVFQINIKNKNQNSKTGINDRKQSRSRSQQSDNNFRITHADGNSISYESSDSMVNRIKSRTMHRTQFELIKCQKFSKDNQAPFEVSISLSCLLCLHLHALSSKLEIMGFLGGHIEKSYERDRLAIKTYKPCRTTSQSTINCEMCPVSQVEQSSNLIEQGYDLLGWFHSHPNFPPIPSRTDLKTQNELQMQFACNNPFIGFILSCVHMDFK